MNLVYNLFKSFIIFIPFAEYFQREFSILVSFKSVLGSQQWPRINLMTIYDHSGQVDFAIHLVGDSIEVTLALTVDNRQRKEIVQLKFDAQEKGVRLANGQWHRLGLSLEVRN